MQVNPTVSSLANGSSVPTLVHFNSRMYNINNSLYTLVEKVAIIAVLALGAMAVQYLFPSAFSLEIWNYTVLTTQISACSFMILGALGEILYRKEK